MTISTSTGRIQYNGNDVTTEFVTNFKLLDTGHVEVIHTSTAAVDTVQTISTHYTVALGASTATITMITAPATNEKVTFRLKPPLTQESDLINGQAFNADTIETALDLGTQVDQGISEELDRSLKMSRTSVIGFDTELPTTTALDLIQVDAANTGFSAISVTALGIQAALDADLVPTLDEFIVGTGTTWVNKTPTEVKTILDLADAPKSFATMALAKADVTASAGDVLIVSAYAADSKSGTITGTWVSSGVTADLGNPAHNSLALTFKQHLGDTVHASQYGAIGDYTTDDTAAIDELVALSAATGRTIDFGDLVCKYTGTLVLAEGVTLKGGGAAKIASFPQYGGDKSKLKPGIKDTISGAAIIFTGTGTTSAYTTVRSDRFASVTPMVKYDNLGPFNVEGIAFIQDMDVYDSGGSLTTGSTDNRATAYTAGIVNTSSQSVFRDVTVFGYFIDAGYVSFSGTARTGDADYQRFFECNITSGAAIIGHDTAAGASTVGFTGSSWIGCGLYGNDHHTRADGVYTTPCLYIDGYLNTSADIRGHSFTGCNFRAYANDAVVLDHCNDIQWVNSVLEFSILGGVTNADAQGVFTGTADTGNITMFGAAFTADPGLLAFLDSIGGKYQVLGAGGFGTAIFGQNDDAVRIAGDSASGDSYIQLTDDITSTTTGWSLRRDGSNSDTLDFRYGGTAVFNVASNGSLLRSGVRLGTAQTISSGSIAKPTDGNYFRVDTESAASTDDLDTITGGSFDGEEITIRAASSSHDVVFKDGTGNLRIAGDFTLTNAQDRIRLMYDGSNWVEISRSDNTA